MKNIVKIAILSIVLINCGSDDNVVVNNNNDSSSNDNNNDTPATFEPQNIEIEIILKSDSFIPGLQSENRDNLVNFHYVIKNENEWNDHIIEVQFNQWFINKIFERLEEVNFNFNQHQILVVFNEFTMGAGATIDIISVTEYEDNIIVVLDNIKGKNGQFMDINFPFEIVKMPKIDKPVEFDTSLFWSPNDD